MSTIDQISYRAHYGSTGILSPAATSLRDQAESDRWQRRLNSWLRAGDPLGRAYLDFGTQAALIHWYADAGADVHSGWQHALVLVGNSDVLTGGYALELDDLDLPVLHRGGEAVPLGRTERGPGHDAIEARARSADVIKMLIPLLANALQGGRRVTMPWTKPLLSEAIMWGLINILEMIGDTQPVSFLTHVSSSYLVPDIPGLFTLFSPDTATVSPPGLEFSALAASLATRFADGPTELRQKLAEHGILESTGHVNRIARLLSLWPQAQSENGPADGTATVDISSENPVLASYGDGVSQPQEEQERVGGQDTVLCPMCLHEITDWSALKHWRWDPREEAYVELTVPQDLNPTQRAHHLHGARVRCPSSRDAQIGAHYLPADYGRFGPPVVLGFVGLTNSGKSHLMASMVGAIVGREMENNYGISSTPLDHAWHRHFMDDSVSPLLRQSRVLPGTREGVIEFADAFLMKGRGGPERVVALFDIAGGDLARLDETKEFLWIANGLFFVIDPERLGTPWAEDETFSSVLDIVRNRAPRGPVNAAIILNKADLVRFDQPVDRWLRYEDGPATAGALDPVEFLRESADIYAYLDARNALAMTQPYAVCDKTTLHVASPTGGADTGEGGVYPRGVTPRRVLRPLVAMLAMTGVLTGPEAERVGV